LVDVVGAGTWVLLIGVFEVEFLSETATTFFESGVWRVV
jgi:hypothetical protein